MAPTKADFRQRLYSLRLSSLVIIWTEVSQRRMQPLSVVKTVDVVGHRAGRLFMGLVGFPVHLLRLETLEKTLHRCVVLAVSLAAHALQELLARQSTAIGLTGELGSSIAVDD